MGLPDSLEGLAAFEPEAENRGRIRTSNLLPRQRTKIQRLTLAATLIPNESSHLRLAIGVLAEVSKQ